MKTCENHTGGQKQVHEEACPPALSYRGTWHRCWVRVRGGVKITARWEDAAVSGHGITLTQWLPRLSRTVTMVTGACGLLPCRVEDAIFLLVALSSPGDIGYQCLAPFTLIWSLETPQGPPAGRHQWSWGGN